MSCDLPCFYVSLPYKCSIQNLVQRQSISRSNEVCFVKQEPSQAGWPVPALLHAVTLIYHCSWMAAFLQLPGPEREMTVICDMSADRHLCDVFIAHVRKLAT